MNHLPQTAAFITALSVEGLKGQIQIKGCVLEPLLDLDLILTSVLCS